MTQQKNQKKRVELKPIKFNSFFKLDASNELSSQIVIYPWPSKYFHLSKSLQPYSGWLCRTKRLSIVLWEAGGFPVRIILYTKKWEPIIQLILTLFNLDVGNELSSQEVALQVFSPLRVFTTVFGMGTGGLPLLGH